MLDYAYAVLRAGVTRSICAAGLHPSIGIHHHNRSNAFVLADDLIEPFRPVVDRLVFAAVTDFVGEADLTPPIKRRLANCLENTLQMGGETRTVRDALGRSASSLAKVFLGESETITLPWNG
jgi:CRISPR-associated protein Cas1